MESGLSSHPHDMVDGKFVAEYDFLIVVDIDQCRKAVVGQSEIVEKRGVLTEWICVVGIIASALIVAEKQ